MKTRQEEMAEQCQAFHNKHPEVWKLFVEFTHDVIRAGFKNYSANAIFERIRWEVDVVSMRSVVTEGANRKPFKLNNNYRAYYARRFHRMYPQHDGFFRTREQTSSDQRATNLPELTRSDYE